MFTSQPFLKRMNNSEQQYYFLLPLSRRGLGSCPFTSRVLIKGVLKNQIFPPHYPLSV